MENRDIGARLGEWNALVRRARIGEKRKYVALMVSSYANSDGTGIHCGIATLAVDCEIGYSTARRYLAWMRQVGLIELVRKGNQRKGLSDEYRLILGPDLLEHVDLPDPEQHRAMKDDLRVANRAKSAERTVRARADLRSPKTSADGGDLRSPKVSGDSAPPDPDLRSPIASADTPDLRSFSAPSALAQGERPPSLYTYPEELTFPNSGDLCTAVTVTRDDEDPISGDGVGDSDPPPRPAGCDDHGPAFTAGARNDGLPACPLCRATRAPRPRASPDRPTTATVIPMRPRRAS